MLMQRTDLWDVVTFVLKVSSDGICFTYDWLGKAGSPPAGKDDTTVASGWDAAVFTTLLDGFMVNHNFVCTVNHI